MQTLAKTMRGRVVKKASSCTLARALGLADGQLRLLETNISLPDSASPWKRGLPYNRDIGRLQHAYKHCATTL